MRTNQVYHLSKRFTELSENIISIQSIVCSLYNHTKTHRTCVIATDSSSIFDSEEISLASTAHSDNLATAEWKGDKREKAYKEGRLLFIRKSQTLNMKFAWWPPTRFRLASNSIA